MKHVVLAATLTLIGATTVQAFATIPMIPWTLEFPTDGAFPAVPAQIGGK